MDRNSSHGSASSTSGLQMVGDPNAHDESMTGSSNENYSQALSVGSWTTTSDVVCKGPDEHGSVPVSKTDSIDQDGDDEEQLPTMEELETGAMIMQEWGLIVDVLSKIDQQGPATPIGE